MYILVASGRVTHVHVCRVWCVQWSSEVVSCCVSLSMLLPLCPPPCVVQHATDEASYLISQADRDGDGRVSECCVVGGGGDSLCMCVLYGARVHMNVYCRCV